MKKSIISFCLCTLILHSITIQAKDQCDFKGVKVGAKLSPNDLMKVLGIKQYTLTPHFLEVTDKQRLDLFTKYGIQYDEVEYDSIGPFCKAQMCVIPSQQTVGDVPVNLEFYFNEHKEITSINISFNSINWDEIKTALYKKLGKNWRLEVMQMGVAPYDNTNNTLTVNREILEHKSGGVNSSNNANCNIKATNYDTIFLHGNRLGAYHGVINIEKRTSNNF